MLRIFKSRAKAIGVDMADDAVKMAQLGDGQKGIKLVYGGSKKVPVHVKSGSSGWQR